MTMYRSASFRRQRFGLSFLQKTVAWVAEIRSGGPQGEIYRHWHVV